MRSRLGIYADLIPILDRAIDAGGGTYTLASHGDATHWRQRVYKFRKQFQAETGSRRYDALVLPRIPGDSTEVVLEVRVAKGLFTPGLTPIAPDSALAAAQALARKLEDF